MDEATKVCTRCARSRPRSAFSRRAAMRDGLRSQCKACDATDRQDHRTGIAETRRRWRQENRDKEREAERRRYARNVERERERKRAWALANPEKVREIKRRTRLANIDKVRERIRQWRETNAQWMREYSRAYRAENHAEVLARMKAWRDANPEQVKAHADLRRARLLGALTVPFSPDQLAQRLSMFAGCWICGGPKEVVDHVKPISKGGAHVLANLRPACAFCNGSKKDRWPFEPSAALAPREAAA